LKGWAIAVAALALWLSLSIDKHIEGAKRERDLAILSHASTFGEVGATAEFQAAFNRKFARK
jgi:hypothetical protein